MTGSTRLLAAVVFLVALAGGVILTSLLVGGFGGGAGPTPSPVAQASATPSTAPSSATVAPPPSESAPASSQPSVEPSESAPATAKPTTAPGIPAGITISALKLDAQDDPDGTNRVIRFEAQGSGTVAARLTTVSPRGETVICLRSDKKDFGCRTTADGSISADTKAKVRAFTLTLRGEGTAAPVVDLALTFPAARPGVTLDHARFDGTGYPDTNGIDVTLTPRADGNVRVVAGWGGHPLLYDLLLDEQGGPGEHDLRDQGPSTGTNTRLAVTAPSPWRLRLRNAEDGFGATDLTVRIVWP